MNVADIIEASAKRIETHGWMQFNGKGCAPTDLQPNCASNAIFFCTDAGEFNQYLAAAELAEYVGGDCRRGIGNIWAWNDAPGQTKENVIATMRACAAIWRAKQENTDASKAAGPEVSVCERGSEPEAGVSRGTVQDYLCAEAGV
jgi:hypothetical protein